MRRILLPIVSLSLAAAATYGARSFLTPSEQPLAVEQAEPAPPPGKAVLVAARDLPVGSFVQPESLRWQDWPDVELPESYAVRGAASETDLVGAVVRRPMSVGEPIAQANLVKPGERGFLAALLDPGMRAMTVLVDESSGNAGLIFPGDRVDLIVTHLLRITGETSGDRRVSETVLEDVRVLAMGTRLTGAGTDDAGTGSQARTATLEITPRGAEKVALVAELGKLSLSLRSLAATAANPPADGAALTWDSDASPALRPENQPNSTVAVVRGGKTETLTVRRGAGT